MSRENDYKEFIKSLNVGDKIRATYADKLEVVNTPTATIMKDFTISRIYPEMLEVITYKNVNFNGVKMHYKIKCYVNIKELWMKGSNALIYPTRFELSGGDYD